MNNKATIILTWTKPLFSYNNIAKNLKMKNKT